MPIGAKNEDEQKKNQNVNQILICSDLANFLLIAISEMSQKSRETEFCLVFWIWS